MARIRTYGLDSVIDPADKIIGTDGTVGPSQGDTKNFSVSALTSYISGEIGDVVGGSGTLNTIPMWTPDGDTLGDSIMVKDSTIPAPDNGIVVKGKFRIDSTGTATDIGEIAAFSNRIVLYKDVELKDGVYDSTESLGTAGQALLSTSTATEWSTLYLSYAQQANDVDIKFGYNNGTNNTTHAVRVYAGSGITLTENAPLGFEISANSQIPTDNVTGTGTLNTVPLWTPDGNTLGDSVLTYDAPNTTINLTGKLVVTSTTNIQGNLTTEAGLTVNTTLADGSGSYGTSGQILSSTGTATQWINNIDTTYTYSSSQDGSDVVLQLTDGTTPQEISLVAGADISLVDNGNNEITINATGGAANTTYDLVGTYNPTDTVLTLHLWLVDLKDRVDSQYQSVTSDISRYQHLLSVLMYPYLLLPFGA